jgi:hypothetical protein
MPRPAATEFSSGNAAYIDLVPEDDVVKLLDQQLAEFLGLLAHVSEADGNVCHAPYTWSVKQVVGHLIDCERVFGYRALRFARGDTTPLPGFDEVPYAQAAESNRCRLRDLVAEFEALRRSHILFWRHLPEAAWTRVGEANGQPVSVRALAYIMAGHARHHLAILHRRLG